MSKSRRTADQDEKKQPQEQPSSQGNNSKSVTPKDVSPQDASARDVIERKILSDDADEREEELLDDAVESTFPASDPIAIHAPDREAEKRRADRKMAERTARSAD